MDRKENRRTVGVLVRYSQSSWSTTSALSLADTTSDPRVLLLADSDTNVISSLTDPSVNFCWSYSSNDLSRLNQVIAKERIGVIHVCDPWLLTEWAISVSFLESFRKNGGITTVALPNPQRRFHDPELIARCFDQILVATEQDRLWLAATGISLERIEILPPAGPRIQLKQVAPAAPRSVVIVGSYQIENQVAELLRNLHEVESGDRPLRLTILASQIEAERSAGHYGRLRGLIERSGVDGDTVTIEVASSNEILVQRLSDAEVVIAPDLAGSAEQMAAVNCALCAPGVVVTTGLRSAAESGAVLQISSDETLWHAVRVIFDRPDIRQEYIEKADRWRALVGPEFGRIGSRRLFTALSAISVFVAPASQATGQESALATQAAKTEAVLNPALSAKFELPTAQKPTSSQTAAERLASAIAKLSGTAATVADPVQDSAPANSEIKLSAGSGLRILMQNRPNMLSQRGGDTVVVEQLTEQLRQHGATVDIDINGSANPADYDVVHLHNFAIRDVTENFAMKAVAAGVPYVVTTLYEDWPKFFNQMMATFQALDLYVKHGQPRERWDDLMRAIQGVESSACWDNTYAATNAAALLVSGTNEAAALRRDYQSIKRIDVHNFGCKVTESGDNGELFRQQTGLKDFVLCVGRLETRKNQLMLLRALEDSDLTVVFAAGGFTYQPDYAAACKAYRRRGKTVFLDRLDPKLLASAYGACRVHALPSWYELPGLVSIEAALYGAAVVATDFGTARDYLGSYAQYCQPGDPESIRQAVERAYSKPVDPSFREHVKQFTWDNTARQVLEVYKQVIAAKKKGQEAVFEEIAPIHTVVGLRNAQITTDEAQQSVTSLRQGVPSLPVQAQPIDPECLANDKLVRAGKFDEAAAVYQRLIQENRSPAAASRGLAVIALLERRLADAEKFFRQALSKDPYDFRAMAGLGTAIWEQGRREEGFDHIVRAAEGAVDDQAIVLQMINPSYALNRLEELQAALERFIRKHPDDLDMCYCLAGCYYRRKRIGQAEAMLHRILLISPTHPGGLELRALMQKEKAEAKASPASLSSSIISERTETPGQIPPITGLPGKPPSATIDQLTFQAEQAKKAQDFDQAISVAQTILERGESTENQRAFASVIIGESLGCKGDLVGAERELRKADGNLAFGFRALNGLGALAAAEDNYDEAEKLFRRSISLVRENDAGLAGLGICAMKRNQAPEAWDYFKKSLEVNPENMRAICGLIQLASGLKRMDELERSLETYLEFRPVDLSVLFSYAGCLYVQGKTDLASEQLRKILVFDPEHKMANDLLREISEKPLSAGRPTVRM